jgi:hypothetical protein
MDLKGFVCPQPGSHAPLARDIAGAAARARHWRHWRCLFGALAGLACGMASAVAHYIDLVLHPPEISWSLVKIKV